MINKVKKTYKHKQYGLVEPEFNGYNQDIPIQEALGSIRKKKVHEAGDTRSKNYRKGVKGWRLGSQDSSFPLIVHGLAAPTTVPDKIGDMYIDTANNKIYISSGTVTSADWRVLN